MKTVFDDREKAYEAKFHIDQELEFKVKIRRDKLLGLWAADKMGIAGDAAKAYALAVVDIEFDATDRDAGHKVSRDFAANGVVLDEAQVRHQMAVFLELAREQLLAEMAK